MQGSRHLSENEKPAPMITIGAGPLVWWSWGDLNPRPQAFVAQIYMFSDLI